MENIYPPEKVYYYKLIRDNVPDNMTARGATYEVETIDDDAKFEVELFKKLVEEAGEVITATTHEGLVSELGDLLDVVDEIKRLKNISDDELLESREAQLQKKGGFAKRLLLIWSENH